MGDRDLDEIKIGELEGRPVFVKKVKEKKKEEPKEEKKFIQMKGGNK